MSGDLVGGRYPLTYPFAKALGLAENGAQGNIAIRSNAEWFGLGGLADGVLGTTEVGTIIAVPVEVGDVIKKISILVGATKGKKVEAGFAAIFGALNAKLEAKEQALLVQSKSAALGEEVLAEKPLTFTLEAPVIVSPTIAPNGFILVEIALEAETMPTCVTVATPKATQAALPLLYPGAPVAFGGTAGAALKAKAQATLGAVTSKAVTPLVFLS